MNPHVYDRLESVEWRRIRVWVALIVLEGYLLVTYFAFTPGQPTSEMRYLIYPFVWINAGLWAISRSDSNPGNGPHRLFAATIAGAYLLGLLYIPGNVGFGTTDVAVDLRIEMYAPGWGPLLAVTSPWIRLFLVPFEVVGYASLSYLLYVNVLDLSRGALSGVFGLVSCVGCTVPVLVPLVGALGGPATSLTTTAYQWSYDLGTLFFLLTLGLLYWSHKRYRG